MSSQDNEHIYITDNTDDEEGEFLENKIDNIISSQKSQYEDSKQCGKDIIIINKQLIWISYNWKELCKEKEKIINDLKKQIANKDGEIKNLNQQIEEKNKEIESLKQEKIEKELIIQMINHDKITCRKDFKKYRDEKDPEIKNLRKEIQNLSNQFEQIKINGEKLENKHLRIEIKGYFIDQYLNLAMPFWFKGFCVKEQNFGFSGSKEKLSDFISNSIKIKISKDDFFNMDKTMAFQNHLSIFSLKTGKGFIFGKTIVYQGEIIHGNGKPDGIGIMLKSTGDVIEGRKSTEEWFKLAGIRED
ncbi:hypothetical protein BCR32DRAFT_290150 [Anaeromyces robustus]|uniref:Uncharacterized protein n=1 Tax=Anaeromyces robustus TaxID=1754192 RepID=A0A1Y1XKR9_9FUNG|nr:hypothetical protein BCR32DRAFT_290150 [Anaeromyces robustus]|eukprot:ORX86302.1 hypothetical protein BCR32DRAFT_290150 [Anaeromyces robustus]